MVKTTAAASGDAFIFFPASLTGSSYESAEPRAAPGGQTETFNRVTRSMAPAAPAVPMELNRDSDSETTLDKLGHADSDGRRRP